MEAIVLCLIAVVFIKWLEAQSRKTKYAGGKSQRTTHDTYRVIPRLLTPTETTFYQCLRQATPAHMLIMSKVRIADVIESTRGGWGSTRFRQQHFDFVICDPMSTKPMLAIELDDSTHQQPDAKARDAAKDAVCRSAAFPLLRVPVQSTYNPTYLRQRMEETIGSRAKK